MNPSVVNNYIEKQFIMSNISLKLKDKKKNKKNLI